jgi:uncharacterized membrane protein (UPF0127 family)
MRQSLRLLAAALVVVGIVLLGFAGAGLVADDGSSAAATTPLAAAVQDAGAATKPFADLTELELTVGTHRLRVAVADDVDERTQGLRQRRKLGPYDGMLFAFEGPTTTAFTMSTVPVALDIGFYDAHGRRVDRLRMEPCPGSEAECPVYRAGGPFVYALETLGGDLPRGRLRPAS